MKIYKFGNDYAFQKEQKSNENQSVERLTERKSDVKNQVSRLGEGTVADAAQSEDPEQEKRGRRKKKETGSQEQEEDGQV